MLLSKYRNKPVKILYFDYKLHNKAKLEEYMKDNNTIRVLYVKDKPYNKAKLEWYIKDNNIIVVYDEECTGKPIETDMPLNIFHSTELVDLDKGPYYIEMSLTDIDYVNKILHKRHKMYGDITKEQLPKVFDNDIAIRIKGYKINDIVMYGNKDNPESFRVVVNHKGD